MSVLFIIFTIAGWAWFVVAVALMWAALRKRSARRRAEPVASQPAAPASDELLAGEVASVDGGTA